MPEKGLLSFIKNKLDNSVRPQEIKRMLGKAGFDQKKIDDALNYIKANKDEYAVLFDDNDFLPNLNGKTEDTFKQEVKAKITSLPHLGLFSGRLRRKDFILGFLFFFGIGYVILSFSALFVSIVSPLLWKAILLAIQQDTNGLLVITIPVLLAPITVMMISMITRRLHDLGLPGVLSFFYLALFVPPFGGSQYGLYALDIALLLLLILLLSIKGNSKPNLFGEFPESKGSFFRRIFNQ
jgi:uncharacterized membrane protein YhaH (DUF805 family)